MHTHRETHICQQPLRVHKKRHLSPQYWKWRINETIFSYIFSQQNVPLSFGIHKSSWISQLKRTLSFFMFYSTRNEFQPKKRHLIDHFQLYIELSVSSKAIPFFSIIANEWNRMYSLQILCSYIIWLSDRSGRRKAKKFLRTSC